MLNDLNLYIQIHLYSYIRHCDFKVYNNLEPMSEKSFTNVLLAWINSGVMDA
jgi:hypothetical protein